MATVICIKTPEIPPGLKMTLPGVGELAFLRDSLTQMKRPSSYILDLLNSMSLGLSPVFTLLRMLDMIISIFNCVKAVKDCITQLSPGPLIKCFEKLFKAFANLIQLFPPVVYAKMILDILSAFRMLVEDMLSVVTIIDTEMARVNAILQKAIQDDDPVLLEIGNCAQEDLRVQVAGIYAIIEVIGKCLAIVLLVLELLAPFIPGLDKKIAKMQEALDSIGSTQPSMLLTPIVNLLVMIATVLIAIETPLKMFLGVATGNVSLHTPALRNL